MISRIQERVRSGLSLSSALAEHDQVFSRLYLNMVRAGEAGGSLNSVIDRIAGYMERSGELRSSIITALIYPAILIVIALLSLIVLMTFIVPQFVPLFEDSGTTLPVITQIVFAVAQFLRDFPDRRHRRRLVFRQATAKTRLPRPFRYRVAETAPCRNAHCPGGDGTVCPHPRHTAA